MKLTEFKVYLGLIEYLHACGWLIICASPPGGTDSRFRKCILPRRAKGEERGLRDEVDVTAHKADTIIFIECKSTLSDSLHIENALGESDLAKLQRLTEAFPPIQLSTLLKQASGIVLPANPRIVTALAVGRIDCEIPDNINVLEITKPVRIIADRQLRTILES